MLKAFLAIAVFVFMAIAQSMGNGISKFTRGHSDPKSCLKFFEDILGDTETGDGCPNDVCECATQGRAQICPSRHGPGDERTPPGPHREQTFGIHSINCTYHPYGEHPLAWTEEQVTNEIGDFKEISQHMDSHVGIYTSDLSKYFTKLDSSKTKYPHLRLGQVASKVFLKEKLPNRCLCSPVQHTLLRSSVVPHLPSMTLPTGSSLMS